MISKKRKKTWTPIFLYVLIFFRFLHFLSIHFRQKCFQCTTAAAMRPIDRNVFFLCRFTSPSYHIVRYCRSKNNHCVRASYLLFHGIVALRKNFHTMSALVAYVRVNAMHPVMTAYQYNTHTPSLPLLLSFRKRHRPRMGFFPFLLSRCPYLQIMNLILPSRQDNCTLPISRSSF